MSDTGILYSRLLAISRRELADRTISPGDAELLAGLVGALPAEGGVEVADVGVVEGAAGGNEALGTALEVLRHNFENRESTILLTMAEAAALVADREALLAERDLVTRSSGTAVFELARRAEKAEARVGVLEDALRDALELAEDGWGYDSVAYFREKWDYAGRSAALRAVLAGGEAAPDDEPWKRSVTAGGIGDTAGFFLPPAGGEAGKEKP